MTVKETHKVGNETYLKYLCECVRAPDSAFPHFVKASTAENDTFHADLELMAYPICSDLIPLPKHLSMADGALEGATLHFSDQEFRAISSMFAFPIFVPVLALMLTGSPNTFLEKRCEAQISAIQKSFDPVAYKTTEGKRNPSVRHIRYRHALARMKLRNVKRHLRQFQIKSWKAVQSSLDICYFYNVVMDLIMAEDAFVSGFTISRQDSEELVKRATKVYVAEMEEIAALEKRYKSESPEGISEWCAKSIVLELLRAKERWIMTVANIPYEAHRVFSICPNLSIPALDEPIVTAELLAQLAAQNQQLRHLHTHGDKLKPV